MNYTIAYALYNSYISDLNVSIDFVMSSVRINWCLSCAFVCCIIWNLLIFRSFTIYYNPTYPYISFKTSPLLLYILNETFLFLQFIFPSAYTSSEYTNSGCLFLSSTMQCSINLPHNLNSSVCIHVHILSSPELVFYTLHSSLSEMVC